MQAYLERISGAPFDSFKNRKLAWFEWQRGTVSCQSWPCHWTLFIVDGVDMVAKRKKTPNWLFSVRLHGNQINTAKEDDLGESKRWEYNVPLRYEARTGLFLWNKKLKKKTVVLFRWGPPPSGPISIYNETRPTFRGHVNAPSPPTSIGFYPLLLVSSFNGSWVPSQHFYV